MTTSAPTPSSPPEPLEAQEATDLLPAPPAGHAPVLSLRGIARTFEVPDADPLHILTDVNLDVYPGEHVAIVGRSGTGKSTLLNILGLIDQASAGSYLLDGVDTATLGESRRAHLRGRTFGFVFQTFNLIPGLTTTENVAAALRPGPGLLGPHRPGRGAAGGSRPEGQDRWAYQPPVRRRAAARGHRTCAGPQASDHSGR